jgi:hypothetical protein
MQIVTEIFEITISDLLSIVLSALLVLLYWKMSKIQSEQKQILESHDDALRQQAEIMSLDYQPDINCRKISAEGDTLYMLLSNDGLGSANALQAKCAIYSQRQKSDGEHAFELASLEEENTVITTHYSSAYSSNEPGTQQEDRGLEKIQPGESSWFKSEIKMVVNENEISPFSDVIQRLSVDWDTEWIAFDLYLGSLDALGRQHILILDSYRNVPLNPMTLEEAIKQGEDSEPIHMSTDEIKRPAVDVFEKDNL